MWNMIIAVDRRFHCKRRPFQGLAEKKESVHEIRSAGEKAVAEVQGVPGRFQWRLEDLASEWAVRSIGDVDRRCSPLADIAFNAKF